MGMAASQARLLMITSRLHDVELKAQQLQNAKLQLSTQQDEAYEDYQKALDATTLTMAVTNGAVTENIVADFNNVFGINASTPAKMKDGRSGYILVDQYNRVVVEDDVYEAYNDFQSGWFQNLDNAYAFAHYMVEGQRNTHQTHPGGNNSALENAIKEVCAEKYAELSGLIQEVYDIFKVKHSIDQTPGTPDWPKQTAVDWACEGGDSTGTVFAHLLSFAETEYGSGSGNLSDTEKEVYGKLVNYFWSHFGDDVFNKVNENNGTNLDGDNYDTQEFNYYVRIYNAIQQHSGCIAISDFDDTSGPAASSNSWLTAMLQSGQMSIETISIDPNGEATCSGASVASDTNLAYTATSSIDKAALAAAEAEYEHTLKVIDRKEQKIDLELNKIETERNALTKQYDSIKKVSEENVDRTFGIFS